MQQFRILLIEDDPDIAWIVQLQLKLIGYEVNSAQDGISGLNVFLTAGADLILLDIDLPGLNGWDVYSRVRQVSPVPIIMLTAYPQQRKHQPPGFGESAECCIEKPFSVRDLKGQMERMLASPPEELVS